MKATLLKEIIIFRPKSCYDCCYYSNDSDEGKTCSGYEHLPTKVSTPEEALKEDFEACQFIVKPRYT